MKESKQKAKNPWKRIALFLVVVIVLSLCVNVYQYVYMRPIPAPVLSIDADTMIPQIETYLDQISSDYVAAVQNLAKQYNLSSWGCGPSSYALARILNTKFFDNKLPINATYNAKQTYQIVQRFSFVKTQLQGANYTVVDHAWIEVYLGSSFLYIDPTIGQFGKYNKIVYEKFGTGDRDISNELGIKYDIIDIRFATLMQKMINRVPVDQEPYPGASINPESMNYYDQVLEDRNIVNSGQEPEDWVDWVSILTKKFM